MGVLLQAYGVETVHILNCKFSTVAQYKKATAKLPDQAKAAGSKFEFKLKDGVIAAEKDVQKIIDGQSSNQLVDCDTAPNFKKNGTFPKAVHVPRVDFWDTNHHILDQATVLQNLKAKSIDVKKPMIFTNSGPKNFCAQAVCQHLGIKDTQVCDLLYKDWKVNDDKLKAAAKEKLDKAAAEKKPEATNNATAPTTNTTAPAETKPQADAPAGQS